MKKSFARLLCLVPLLLIFVACSTAPVPTKADRWAIGETATYNISKISEDFIDYAVGFQVQGSQARPDTIETGSTLTYTVSQAGTKWQVNYSMTVLETYPLSKLKSGWESKITDSSVYTKTATTVTFTQTMTSVAIFDSFTTGGTPSSSEKVVKSTFLSHDGTGKYDIIFNDFDTKTTYTKSSDNKSFEVKSTFNDNTNGDYSLKENFESTVEKTSLIDNEMFLFVARSVDMPTLANANLATFDGFNAVTQSEVRYYVQMVQEQFKFEETDTETFIRVMGGVAGIDYPYVLYFEDEKTSIPPTSAGKPIKNYQLEKMSQGYMFFDKV